MDIVDALKKIRKLEKELESKELKVKQLNKQVKTLKIIESKLLQECEVLSHELSKWKPFNDVHEVILESKLNKK